MGRIKREEGGRLVVRRRHGAGRTQAILAAAGARRATGDGISASRAALLCAAPGRSQKSSRAKEKPKKQKRVSSRTKGGDEDDEALAAGPGPATADRAMVG